jgi:hypothetical protein
MVVFCPFSNSGYEDLKVEGQWNLGPLPNLVGGLASWAGVGPLMAGSVTNSMVQLPLESILRNRFGRNLRIKPNFVKFKFAIMTLYGFKNTLKSQVMDY